MWKEINTYKKIRTDYKKTHTLICLYVEKLIVTTQEELQTLIEVSVRKAVEHVAPVRFTHPLPQPWYLFLHDHPHKDNTLQGGVNQKINTGRKTCKVQFGMLVYYQLDGLAFLSHFIP